MTSCVVVVLLRYLCLTVVIINFRGTVIISLCLFLL